MKTVVVTCVLMLSVAACGSGDDQADATDPTPTPAATSSAAPETEAPAPEGVTVDITIQGGEVTPVGERVKVKVGEPVTLNVTSDATDEIHVHSDPEHTFNLEVGDNTFEFTVDTPGQVAVESHHLDVTIVQLVVAP